MGTAAALAVCSDLGVENSTATVCDSWYVTYSRNMISNDLDLGICQSFVLKITIYCTDHNQTSYLGVVSIAERAIITGDFDLGKWRPF